MLRLNLAEISRQKGLKSAAVHLRAFGFGDKESRGLTKPMEVQMIRDSSVQRICEAFDCTPNELFRWYGTGRAIYRR